MNKLIVGFLVLFSSVCHADNAICVTKNSLADILKDQQLLPVFEMTVANPQKDKPAIANHAVFYANYATKEWILVKEINPNLFCTVGIGTDISVYSINKTPI